MPFAIVKNFGTGGISTDPFEENRDSNQWEILANIDLVAGDISACGQDIQQGSQCPITPKWMFSFSAAGVDYLFISDGGSVYATSGGSWTMLISGWDGGLVTFAVFLGSLIVNSHTNGPFYWDRNQSINDDSWVTGQNITWNQESVQVWATTQFSNLLPLPGWFPNGTCLQMVAYRNFLVAIGVNDPARSPSLSPYLICWSDAAPAGGIPSTWDPLPTNVAGDTLVQDTPGSVGGGATMRNDLIIYKTDGAVYRLSFVERSDLIMHTERLYQGYGVDYPGAIAELSGVHYLTTRSGIMSFNGQTMTELDFGRLQESVRAMFRSASDSITSVSSYPGRKQIWVAYRRSADEPYFGILKYDVTQNAYSVSNFSGKGLTSICYGSVGSAFVGSTDAWATGPDEPWATGSDDAWASSISDPLLDTMFMAVGGDTESSNSIVVRYEPSGGPKWYDGSNKVPRAVRYGIRLNENPGRTIIKGVYPLARGSATLQIRLGHSWAPWQANGPVSVTWGEPRSFRPGIDRFLPMRSIGEVFAIEIQSDDGLPWSLAGFGVEFDTLGARG